jgi:hypothetical protein
MAVKTQEILVTSTLASLPLQMRLEAAETSETISEVEKLLLNCARM